MVTNTTVTATFNESVLSSSIGFVLKDPKNNTVTTTLTYNDSTHTATLTPSAPLAKSTTYTASVSSATDSAGHTLASPVSWSFTTVAVPTVTGQTPASGASGVVNTTTVTATFNESVLSSSIGFVLKDPSNNTIASSLAYNDTTHTATLTPNAPLAPSTKYTATVSGAKDAAGNLMTASKSWSFTTTTTVPTVTGQTPASGATGMVNTTTVTATFNESVLSSSIGFVLKDPSNNTIASSLAYNDTTHTATLTPNAPLAPSTKYTATVSGAKDAAGNLMTASKSWSFTTTATVPTVTGQTPASGATGVAVASHVTATFNESVQASTVNITNFTLKDASGKVVPASVTYSDSTHTATLTPSAALAPGTTFTASVSGVKDAAGNLMTSAVAWSFTTPTSSSGSTGDPTTLAPSLGPPPSPGPNVIWVSTQSALQTAFTNLASGQTIVIQPGTYNLSSTLYIGLNSQVTNVTIRGSTDNFNDVVLLGKGMDNSSYGNVPDGHFGLERPERDDRRPLDRRSL